MGFKRSQAILIHDAIDYNFHQHFGTPGGSLAARAAQIDRSLRDWLTRHPDGLVVSLGEGLETQAERVDNGRMRWLSVDLPQAMALRERFITPGGRFEHLAVQRIVAGLDSACGRLGRDLYYRARLADVSGAGTGGAAVL
jgi:hypothetical protein